MKLANELRLKYKQIQEIQNEYTSLSKTCKHSKNVILHSEYRDAYSYPEDWTDEIRLCLICGKMESGNNLKPHKLLINPIKRFHFSFDLYGPHSEFTKTVSHNPTKYSFSEVMKWVNENGSSI